METALDFLEKLLSKENMSFFAFASKPTYTRAVSSQKGTGIADTKRLSHQRALEKPIQT